MMTPVCFCRVASVALLLLVGASAQAQTYKPSDCQAIRGTMNLFWRFKDTCQGIQYTDGTFADTWDRVFTMNGVSSSDVCVAGSGESYEFDYAPNSDKLNGHDITYNVYFTWLLGSDGDCYYGTWVLGVDTWEGYMWAPAASGQVIFASSFE
jgi:hypothetical protein